MDINKIIEEVKQKSKIDDKLEPGRYIDEMVKEVLKTFIEAEIEMKEQELIGIDYSVDHMFGYKTAIEHDIQHLEEVIKTINN